MDDERLKNDGSVLGKQYFEEQLQRLVSAYLDVAEDMALRQIPMTMQDWEKRLNRFIEVTDRKILQDVCRTQEKSQQKLPRPMPKVNLKDTASFRIASLKVTSTG